MNKACILRLVHDMHTGKVDLWCQVMRGKYKWGLQQHGIVVQNTDSHLWMSMVKLWTSLREHNMWIVKDGRTIGFFHDVWIKDCFWVVDFNLLIPANLLHVK